MPPEQPLAEYRERRDFARTPEPDDSPRPSRPSHPAGAGVEADPGPLTFVVQKHDATRLHYDLRLEVDGVLKSWPVPRGPSLDPAQRRLAVMTEDHPLDYAAFEGVIPGGQYGAGEVIVWDHGTYSPDEGGRLSFHDRAEAEARMRAGLAAGKIAVTLRGHRLKGSWALVKTAQAEDSWLLLKHRDGCADAQREILDEDTSVISGLTIADLRAGRLPDRARGFTPVRLGDLPGARRGRLPGALSPMLASPAERAFSDPGWLFEPKLDGVRALAALRDGAVTLRSRTGRDITAQYPALAAALAQQPAHELLLDGEIVALDDRGAPSFEALQQRLNLAQEADVQHAEARVPVIYFAFDLLALDGFDLRRVPLEHRAQALARALLPGTRVQPVHHVEGDGEAAYAAAVRVGFEGVLAKRRDSRYEAGKRSRQWLKIKARQSDDFVVCGYSAGNGARADSLGALLIATRDDAGRLVSVGRVGSGFDNATLRALRRRLDALRAGASPFDVAPAEPVADVTWVRPEIVVEVAFAQWTADGHLRAPVFLRLRPDKPAAEVRRVAAVAPRGATTPAVATPASDADALDRARAAVLEQLERGRDRRSLTLAVEGQEIALSNLDKVLWPEHERQRALTKRDLLVYFATVAPVLLPQLRDRPLTLTRYPNGITGAHFYQKHDEHAPSFVERFVAYADVEGGDRPFLLCNNLATLLWLGQMADLALHTSLARLNPYPDGAHLPLTITGSKQRIEASLLNYPDFVLFDLDPYIYAGTEAKGEEPELNRRAFRKTVQVARWLKDLLDAASLSSFVKTSGATGLHVTVPVLRHFDYTAVRGIAETLGGFLVRAHPRDVTMAWPVEQRTGKVFFDVNQNARIKNLACAYSPRAKPGAPVSMPLRWDEVDDVYPTDFTILTAPARIAERGDLWAGLLDAKHDLQALIDAV